MRFWAREVLLFGRRLARDTQTLFWNIVFFVVLQVLVCAGLAAGDPDTALLMSASIMGLTLFSGGLYGVGVALTGLRVEGALAPYGLTTTRRRGVLGGYLIARGALIVTACVVELAVAVVVFDVRPPFRLGAFLLLVAAGAASALGLGFVVAATARARHTANAWANLIFLPLIILGGLALPQELLPRGIRVMAAPLPSSALIDGLSAVWAEAGGLTDVASPVGLMLLWGAVTLYLGGRYFPWTS